MKTEDYESLMSAILNDWDKSIFLNGGNISDTEYTNIYQLLGYNTYRAFLTDDFFEEFNNINETHYLNAVSGLTDHDKNVLITHSSYLFDNNEIDKFILKRYMLKLALLVNRYRQSQNKHSVKQDIKQSQPKVSYANKSQQEKITTFQNRINDIIELMGGRNIIYDDKEFEEFKETLLKAHKNPKKYIFHDVEEKLTLAKTTIRKYLKGLKLFSKSNQIDNFLSDIK